MFAIGGAERSANELVHMAIQDNAVCSLPGGNLYVEEPIVPTMGLIIQGVGSHKPHSTYIGTSLIPAPGFTGNIIQSVGKSTHSIKLRDFRIDGAVGDAIDFQNNVDGGSIIDNVAILRSGGHGLSLGTSTSFRIGTIQLYLNGGAGIYSKAQLLNIGFLIGDNNAECLMSSDANIFSTLNINIFRAERFNQSKGHNIVFKLSMRGGCVNLGQGKVHLGGNDGGAQSWIEVDTHTIVKADFITTNDLDAYKYAYKCERTGISYTPHELSRRPFSFGKAPIIESLY